MTLKTKYIGVLALILLFSQAAFSQERYVRFNHDGEDKYGLVSGETVKVLEAGLFPMSSVTEETVNLSEIKFLPPTKASKVFAVGMNFASHLASQASGPPPLFLKLPTSLVGHDEEIRLPNDAQNVHFEGELVLVIGKTAKNVTEARADEFIFGVTAGNDLTERSWQGRDLQWLRAKAADGFGPVGPYIATGLKYQDLLLTTRVNEETVQEESTKNMIHSPAKVVSYLSQYFTLEPGDLIFMGTPGRTRALESGDVVTVTIDGIGKLSNKIIR